MRARLRIGESEKSRDARLRRPLIIRSSPRATGVPRSLGHTPPGHEHNQVRSFVASVNDENRNREGGICSPGCPSRYDAAAMDTTRSEQRQTIALLSGAMGVLALGITVVVSARAATSVLIAAGVALGFYAVLLLINVLQNLEDPVEARRTAQLERFLDMLREMRRLLRLNW